VNERCEGLFLFVRGTIRRNEVDPVQFATLRRGSGQCHVATMYGIESSSE
jgi:hypothetical protein